MIWILRGKPTIDSHHEVGCIKLFGRITLVRTVARLQSGNITLHLEVSYHCNDDGLGNDQHMHDLLFRWNEITTFLFYCSSVLRVTFGFFVDVKNYDDLLEPPSQFSSRIKFTIQIIHLNLLILFHTEQDSRLSLQRNKALN